MTSLLRTVAKGLGGLAMLSVGVMELGPEIAGVLAWAPIGACAGTAVETVTRWKGLLALVPVGWALAAAVCLPHPRGGRAKREATATVRSQTERPGSHAAAVCHRQAALARSRELAAYRRLMECRLDRLEAHLAKG